MKNDWLGGDLGTRSAMNLPLWVASGIYNSGANRLELQIAPGWIRYPAQASLVGSGGSTQFLINTPAASTYYTVFVRSDFTLMVSGSTSASVPGPPRWDAEPIGAVFTGASLSTANLKGPWNQANSGDFERRGEYVAITASRPRVVYTTGGAKNGSIAGSASTSSGIAFLTPAARANVNQVFVQGTVQWVPSGTIATTGRTFFIQPAFQVQRPNAAVLATFSDTYESAATQNPDSATALSAILTTSFSVVDAAPDGAGYQLVTVAHLPSITATAGTRINDVRFSALFGVTASADVES